MRRLIGAARAQLLEHLPELVAYLLMAGAVVVLCFVGGCGHSSGVITRAVVAGVADTGECAVSDAGDFRDAIQKGGSGWITAIFDLIQCAPKVYSDVQAELGREKLTELELQPAAELVASAGDDVPVAKGWSKRAIKRLIKCKRMYDALYTRNK